MSLSEWRKTTILNVATKVFSGGTPNTKNNKFWGGNIPWLSSGETRNRFIEKTENSITNTGVSNSSTKLAKIGDIIIASAGQGLTRGQVSYCLIDTYINQSIIAIRPNQKIINSKYLFYNLSSRYQELRQISDSNAIRGSLTTKQVGNLDIVLPSMDEQQKISEILSSIDEKIELNSKINKILEGIAQAIFKSWFIDFVPFDDDELIKLENGNIPKKWKVMKLRDVCNIQKGLSYKGKHLKIFGTPMINLGCIIPGGDFRSNKMKYYDGDFKSQHTVNPGDIVIANTDMTSDRVILGSPIIVPEFNFSTIIFTHHLFAFKDLKISREYLYYFLKSEKFRKRAEGYANGTTVLSLSKEDILSIDLLVPDNITLEKFTSIAEKLIKLKQNNDQENLKLEKIRESLLPKLISGEIQVTTEVNTNAEVR